MKINENMNIFTIRKKILLASKLIGVALISSYILSTKLPVNTDISFVIWSAFVVVLVCAIDLLMARFITKPVSELNEAARNMAELNFSHPCQVESRDEFGQLAESLNMMAENLQQAFSSLEDANRKLEQDVEQKKRLLAERKELVDNLSHEMKTPLSVIRAYAEGLQDETDEAKRQKYSKVIITETERMSRLITILSLIMALAGFGCTMLLRDFKQFSLAYLVIALFAATPVFLAANTSVKMAWIDYHPFYHVYMGLKNAFFGVPTTSPAYYVGAIGAIILLFILVEAAFRKEMGKEG